MMDEGEVKAATLAHVRAACGRRRKPIVTAEFTLGRSGVRADLAVFAETTIGIEIKTARDTLRRLPAQMEGYCRHFDHAIAVIAPCHMSTLKPDHINGASLWTYDSNGVMEVIYEAPRNFVSNEALSQMLTRAERTRGDFKSAMIARYAECSARFWKAVGGRAIRPTDLPLLSRFTDSRLQSQRLAMEREARWASWLAAQDEPVLAST